MRERKEDIDGLLDFFVARESKKMGLANFEVDVEARQLLKAYDYQGNIRELENVVARALILAEDGVIFNINRSSAATAQIKPDGSRHARRFDIEGAGPAV